MMLIPLYVHPLDDPGAWRAAGSAPDRPTVIANVHNGPGSTADPAYENAIGRLRAAGVPVIGYVDLGYGTRSGDAVRADLSEWSRYQVDGVFFDQVPSGEEAVPVVADAVRTARGMVVLNPGTRPHAGYRPLADIVCTFEGHWSDWCAADGCATADGPDWANGAHLVYGVPPDQLEAAQVRLRERVPHGFVTDLDAPHPYRGLPAWAWAVAR